MMENDQAVNGIDSYVSICELRPGCPQFERLSELSEFYCLHFGAQPRFFVRIPGRVNIIGEHVDYCGYPVLPMAIDQCILLAVGPAEGDSLLKLRNMQPKKYEDFDCDLNFIKSQLEPLQPGAPKWYKYFLCGIKGIYKTIELNEQPLGMRVALSGNIPPAAGLSSSSALVSAAVLATAHLYKVPLLRNRLASISANCERYIGTQGGGMDQAIAYLAQKGYAQFIEFQPKLNATPIRLPKGACFIVANSLADKMKAASSDFNERVVECRLGARIIAHQVQLSNWREILRFAQLQVALGCSLTQLRDFVVKYLPKDLYTRDDVCKELNISESELENDFLTANTQHMTKFKLRQRASHVIEESLRVERFREICEKEKSCNGSTHGDSNMKILNEHQSQCDSFSVLSKLMRESHSSLRKLYECSHPDLDRLVEISDASGVGARLTGAGWGGCIVALCDSMETSERYISELKEKYFSKLPAHILDQHSHNDFGDVVFATFPGHGAEMFTMPTI